MERELDDELRFHLEREVEKYRREGMPAKEAMRRARLAFGGVEVAKEASRDGRGLAFLEAVAQDLRYAVRALRRNPGFTVGVVLTLVLGIRGEDRRLEAGRRCHRAGGAALGRRRRPICDRKRRRPVAGAPERSGGWLRPLCGSPGD